MHSYQIDETLKTLRPVLKSRKKAQKLLEKRWRDQIAIVWTKVDIHRLANERNTVLTNAEAREILRELVDKHDASCGINWETLCMAMKVKLVSKNISSNVKIPPQISLKISCFKKPFC